MAWLGRVIGGVAIWILVWLSGAASLLRLAWFALTSVAGAGTFLSRLQSKLSSPDGLRTGLAAARAFLPTLAIDKVFVHSYANTGTVVVTRFDDVKEVLRRDQDFEVVYGPRMREITGGADFFLGMQDTPAYTRDVSNMRLVVRRDDVPQIIVPFAAAMAERLVRESGGLMDVPQALTLIVPAVLLGQYFGAPRAPAAQIIHWTTLSFWYLFSDLGADKDLGDRALRAASCLCADIDATIAARKATPQEGDDVLNRCLAMQGAALPGMDDLEIRNNLIGLVIGAVPTISKASIQALDQLLERPDALAGAKRAALSDNDALLAQYVFEALRFNPINPLIYRRAVRDTVIAPNTFRSVHAKQGSMVFAMTLSAMFDPLRVSAPSAFRPGRPAEDYILWGDGLHACFGAHINLALIPAILKPLLARNGLRRAAGATGQIDSAGTPFPVHLWVEFDD